MLGNVLENVWSEIINDKYEAYYQPQYDSSTGRIIGAEALARLNDPNGIVSPAKFISLLEKNKMIDELDTLIFESVCQFLKQCKEDNVRLVPISVNLSRDDFYDDLFIDGLEKIRKQYDIDPELIRIEVSEIIALENKNLIDEVIAKFHKYGFSVTLDNSNGRNASMMRVRYDAIKLDMNLIDNNELVVSSILENANSLGISVYAKSVETEKQVELLKTVGINTAQGYYYAKPMSKNDFYKLLSKSMIGTHSLNNKEEGDELEVYKTMYEKVSEQANIYYWEYIVATKEMYPCSRCMRDFGLSQIVYNYPESIIQKENIPNNYVELFRNLYNRIDNGEKHIEIIVPMSEKMTPFIIRCDSEFDSKGKPIKAYCSAIEVVEYKTEEKKSESWFKRNLKF